MNKEIIESIKERMDEMAKRARIKVLREVISRAETDGDLEGLSILADMFKEEIAK